MEEKILDYQGLGRRFEVPWWRTMLAATGVAVAVIGAVNALLVWQADKSWGSFFWIFFLIPLANMVLVFILWACSALVRHFTGGERTAVYRWVVMAACATAVAVDAAVIGMMAHGC